MSKTTWQRTVRKEVNEQIKTIKITSEHIENVLQYGAMTVVEHDIDKDGKLSGAEKKAIAQDLLKAVAKYASRKWLPKILNWFKKKVTEYLTSKGILKPHI